ncbi:MAG: hypothetical protein D6731_22400 [Planctomycetota bacterium]|nr:MAG: hypothetical protein D6731_22400 [Planctomycetota bacterium]
MQRKHSGRLDFSPPTLAPSPDVRRERRERDRSESARLPLPRSVPSPYVVELSDENFAREVLASPLPVVVDFWAETCRPCRQQEPVIAALAEELAGRVKVGRLDVYRSPRVPAEYMVRGVPHLMVVRSGEVVLELVGDHGLERLRSELRSLGLF